MIRTVLLGTLAGVGLTFGIGLAQAADLSEPVVVEHDWTGVYLGLNAGYGFSDDQLSAVSHNGVAEAVLDNVGTHELDLDPDGLIAGGQLGYNLQFGAVILGVEADAQYADVEGSETETDGDQVFTGSQKLRFLSTVRGRLGFVPTDQLLIFGTAGLAVGDLKNEANIVFDPAVPDDWPLSESSTETGWTAGGGVELSLSEQVSLKAEYLYVDLGNESIEVGGSNDPNETVTYKFENVFHVVRAGLNWYF